MVLVLLLVSVFAGMSARGVLFSSYRRQQRNHSKADAPSGILIATSATRQNFSCLVLRNELQTIYL